MWLANFFKSMIDTPAQTYNLLSLFGMDKASEGEKEEFLGAATHAVLTAVVGRIEEKLPADKAEEFHRLFETNASDAEKAVFFTAHIPDFKDLLLEELARFNREAIARGSARSSLDEAKKTE